MDLILCWLVAPVGLVVIAVGNSLLLERLIDFALPWTLRPAMGMAVMIVIAQFGTATDATAEMTLPAIVLLGVVGMVMGRRGVVGDPPSLPEVGVATAVFLLFASPFLLSGEASWAGYIKLDDNATWLAITEHVFEHGRGLGEPAPSTHQQVLEDYLGGTYPIGGFVPMAVMSWFSGQDVAFTLQPSMAAAAAMMALLLFELARRLVRGVGPAAFVAVVSSLSALLVGYYLWGGVKELVMAVLLPLGPLLAGRAADADWPRRMWVALGLAIAAVIVVLAPGGATWVLPTLIPALWFAWRRYGRQQAVRLVVPVAVFTFILVLPVLIGPTGPFDPLNQGINEGAGLGNLIGPISLLQGAGLWPSLDFRTDPELEALVKALCFAVIAAALATMVFVVKSFGERGAPLAGYIGGGILGAALIMIFASSWVDGKVLATLSPGILATALIGIVLVGQRTDFRNEARMAAALVTGVVLWGGFLAYQGVWFAPREHYVELEEVGERFAGQGPTLSTEVSIYGPRHFFDEMDAEGASDRRRRQVLLSDGSVPGDGELVDLDRIRSDQLAPYNLLVTRRGPATSRPPATFSLAYSGDHYEVWERRQPLGELVDRLPLGTHLDAGDVPDCTEVARLAGDVGEVGTLIGARVGEPIAVEFEDAERPTDWGVPTPYSFAPTGDGTLNTPISVDGGEYEVWLGGVIFGGLKIRIDGEEIASLRADLENEGAMDQIATISLSQGEHKLELEYSGADLHPGSGVDPYGIGPLELRTPQGSDLGLVTVQPARYRSLCEKRWDWIEAYAPAAVVP